MTTTSTPNQPIERKSRMPSQRDFEIFRLSEITGLTHAEIALTSVKLTRRRISQIVARVRRWLSLHPCQDPRLASELQRKQLARHTERMHLEHVISKARDELIYRKQELTTTTTKDDGTKTTTIREQPFNVQVLKTYLRAVQALAKLHQQPDVNIPTPEECQFPWLEGAINEVYDQWSDKIWSGKLKPEGIFDLIEEIVTAVLKAATTQACFASQGEGPVPAEPVGNALRGVPCATNVDQTDDTLARSASEGNVLSTTTPPGVSDAPTADSSFVLCPSSFPLASLPSQTEAPASQESFPHDDASTPVTAETSASSPSADMDAATKPASQENRKREAPPVSLPPRPPAAWSPDSSVAPSCPATG